MFATTEERQPTNRGALYFSIVLIVALVGVFGFCCYHADIYRIINGYDDCGNVCGRKNSGNSLTYCGPNDKTNFPYTLWNGTVEVNGMTFHRSTCVNQCGPGYDKVATRCIPKLENQNRTFVDDVKEYFPDDMAKSWPSILISCAVATVFSFIILVLFRYVIKQIIWGIYIGIIVFCLIASIAFIVLVFVFKDKKSEVPNSNVFLIPSGIFALTAIIIAVALYFFRKRIQLVIEIFKEAAKVLSDAPGLLFQPMLTFIFLMISFVIFIVFIGVFASSGKLTEAKNPSGGFIIAYYQANVVVIIGHILNVLIFYWFTMFVYGCQHFIIASAVSQWYFTRDKSKLDSPQYKGFSHLLKFHIGSICFGSYLILLVKIVLGILRGLANNNGETNPAMAILKGCFRYILDMVEKLLEFLLRNSYIVIALEGTGLVPSGKRAVKLLKDNLMDVIALNQFGDIVMVLARIFIGLLAGTLCYSLVYKNDEIILKFAPAIIAAIIGFFIIHCFMAVFEMGVDTIFICFCVDYEKNDGVSQPYYMSPTLMEAMKVIKEHAGGSFNFGGSGSAQNPMMINNGSFQQPNAGVFPSQQAGNFFPHNPHQPQPYYNHGQHTQMPYNYQQHPQQYQQHMPYPTQQTYQNAQHQPKVGFDI